MPTVSSLFAHKVAAILHPAADTDRLLRAIGLDPDAEQDVGTMIQADDYYGFLEQAAREDPEGWTVPLRVGASMQLEEYGAFGLAWKSALTLRGSIERAERYALVLSRVSGYGFEPHEKGGFMHLHRNGERNTGLRLSNEATISSILAISRQASARIVDPVEVHFKHGPPERTDDHEAHFRCPVIFHSDRDAILFASAALDAPNKVGDLSISRYFDTVLADRVTELGSEMALDSQVRDYVARQLSEGIPTVGDVASALGMSVRTLQRRLADEGRSYQDLVDGARRELARRLLRDTRFSLIDVAFMTGFASQSAFSRAFKRWEGETPRSYRLETSRLG